MQPSEQANYYSNLPLPDEPSTESFRLTPNNPPWNSLVAFLVFLASIVAILIFPAIFVGPYIGVSGNGQVGREALELFLKTDPTAVMLQILGIFPAHLATLLLCWTVVTRGHRFSYKDTLGWFMGRFRVWHSLAIVVCFYVLSIVAVLVFGKVENNFDQMLGSSKWVIIPVAFLATFTAPIVEEVVYRGIMYSAWQRSFGKVTATLIVTILFTAVHGFQYSQGAKPDIATLSILFLLSLTLTLLRAWTSSLLPSIVLHFSFNAIQSLLLIAGTFLMSSDSSSGL